jgi:hypothetical protein
MVLFDSRFRSKYRDAVHKARSEKMRCVKLENGLYYVARREGNHGRYLVQVDSTKTGMFATCRTIRGAACPSFGVCAHLAKVYESMIAEGFRIGRKERSRAA